MTDYFGYNVKLCMNITDIDDKIIIRSNDKGIKFHELARQMADAVDLDQLLGGENYENQAKELRKILILAGIDVENELANTEVQELLSDVLQNFDPKQALGEEEAIFATQMRYHDHRMKQETRSRRRGVVKKVSEDYVMQRAREEKEIEARLEREAQEEEERKQRQAATAKLMSQMDAIADESEAIKAKFKQEEEAKLAHLEAEKQAKAEKEK